MCTPRLRLRAVVPEDFDALLAYHSDPEVVRYVPFEPRSREDMALTVDRKRTGTGLRRDGDHLDLAVTLAESGRLIGDVILFLSAVEHASVEVGYMFAPAHAGRGYATEAVRAMLDLAFADLGAHRVWARVDVRNPASRALCERLGMRLEAHLVENEWFKGAWSSEIDYALLDREWPAASRPARATQGAGPA